VATLGPRGSCRADSALTCLAHLRPVCSVAHFQEVLLIHSVVSGKKIVMYNGSETHTSDELSRAFSYSWYDGDHVLRLDIIDIVEVGTQMAKRGADKMYELTVSSSTLVSVP
jgi:hypothetical protein